MDHAAGSLEMLVGCLNFSDKVTSSHSTPRFLQKRNEGLKPYKGLLADVHNSPKIETTDISTSTEVGKLWSLYIRSTILLGN